MKVLYRADGGHPIGTGHIYRAVRLLGMLETRTPLEARILTAKDDFAIRVAHQAPARVTVLSPRRDLTAVKPRLEAGPVLAALAKEPADLVVVDMLDTPEQDMAALHATGVPLMTLDDRGAGRFYADAIVNTLVEEPEPERLRPGTRLYQGGAYAVLDPIYNEMHGQPFARAFSHRCRVLVAMGGADAAGLTVRVARALTGLPDLVEVACVNGPAFPHRVELDAVLASAPWPYQVPLTLPNLLELYRWCDLALVAGGLTMYEVCCTGTPALAVCQPIDHQLELAEALTAAGAMKTVGYGLEASEARIREETARLAGDPSLRQALAARGPALVDGRGTARVADAMIATACRAA